MPYIGKAPADIIATAVDTTTGTFSGAVSAASVDADGGVTIDNITIDGTEIDLSSGDMTIDVAGTISLDADSGSINLLDGGTTHAELINSSNDFIIKSSQSDKDMIFKGVDGGSLITALTLDMSDAGKATFNSEVRFTQATVNSQLSIFTDGTGAELDNTSGAFTIDTPGDIILDADGGDIRLRDGGTEFAVLINDSSNLNIQSVIQDKDIKFTGNDGGSGITALTLDMSEAGQATFNSSIVVTDTVGINSSNTSAFASAGDNFFSFGTSSSDPVSFSTNNTERIRILSGGNTLLGNFSDQSPAEGTNAGIRLGQNGGCQFSASGVTTIDVNRVEDGKILGLRSAGTEEGTVTVSGNTVSYNAFSGSHWSRLTDNSKPTILKGTVIETIEEMCDWYQIQFTIPKTEENPESIKKVSIALPDDKSVGDTISHTYESVTYDDAVIIKEDDNKHTKCKISDTADSKRVYGVFADWDNDDDTVNDMYVTAVGTHVIRINKDVTVSAGDLLSSNGDGTAKVQDDDIIRSKTIGKVLTNIKQETYDDGSYTVPCALYCG